MSNHIKDVKESDFTIAKKLLICLRDNNNNRHLDPILMHSETDALRFVGHMLMDKKMIVSMFPQDFDLIHLADIYNNGNVILVQKKIINCKELVKDEEKEVKK